MAFTKIRQTIAAFRSEPPETFEDTVRRQHDGQRRVYTGPTSTAERPNRLVRFVFVIVVVFGLSWAISTLFGKLFYLNTAATGIVTSTILTFVLSNLHAALLNRITDKIPFYKLNAFFGSKVEETVAAFRRRKTDPSQPQLL